MKRPLLFLSLLAACALRAQDARLANLSTRAPAGTGAAVLTSGFVIGPSAAKPVLIRAVGPTLATFGLTGVLADPLLTLINAAGTTVATNDNWLAADTTTMAAAGAFALPAGSRDAALVVTLPPGAYTAQVTGTGATTGLALIEIYELAATGPRILNISTRAIVGSGNDLVLPGLVISPGTGPRRLLIRAAGPALAGFGLTSTLTDPTLTVTNANGTTTFSTNNDWGTPLGTDAASAATLASAASVTGAFAFSTGSRDAAVLVDLASGNYSIQVSGAGAATGLALVEVYDLTGVTLPTTPTPDLAYIASAATGDKIPHPLSLKTVAVNAGATTLQLPENMAYIPGGNFTFGTGTTATTKTLEAYAIAKYAVTNAEWKTFLDATGSRSYPTHWTNGIYPTGKAAHPVLYVSLTSANAYCAWISQRTGRAVLIPSAEQWEKAARGPNSTLYPWGNTLDAAYNAPTGVLTTKCNFNAVVAADYLFNQPNLAVTYNDSHSKYFGVTTTVAKIAGYDTNGAATPFAITSTGSVNAWVNHDTYTGFIYTDLFDRLNAVGGTTTPVGTYENGKSAYGCYDMAGNVWQWTSTLITATNGAEAGQLVNEVRGGSWYATGNSCRAIGLGEGRAASGNFNTIGFRIAPKL